MQNAILKPQRDGFTQFELTKDLLQNLYKYNLTPTAKLVLLELSSHYNDSKVVFPSMDHISKVLGVSLSSVKQAIKDLIKEGLIIKSKRQKTSGNHNLYGFTSKVQISACKPSENKTFKSTKSAPFNITNKGTKKSTNIEDFKILKSYAIQHNAKNIQAYINTLVSNGTATQILKEYKQAKANNKAMLKSTAKQLEALQYAIEHRENNLPADYFEKVREKLKKIR